MANNFGGFNGGLNGGFKGGFNQLPNQNSFQRRSEFSSINNVPSNLNNNIHSNINNNNFQNRYSADGKPIKSLDGREWETRDQAMVANKEYYKKIGRDLNHTKENPDAFNLTNFYKFNKD